MRRFVTTLPRTSYRTLYTTRSLRADSNEPFSGPYDKSYDTTMKQKDPFKTVSSGYPQNNQGLAFVDQDAVHPEELAAASASPTTEGAAAAPESVMGGGREEVSKTGHIGGYVVSVINDDNVSEPFTRYKPSRLG